MTIDWETHKSRVRTALSTFLENDSELLKIDANERSISFKIGSYLSDEYKGERNVDCEYNRKGDEVKRLPTPETIGSDDTKGKTIFPDIIIHSRGNDNGNELIIEIKKEGNHDTGRDIEKLVSLTSQAGNYKYKYGMHITFGEERIHDIDVYENGEKEAEKTKELKEFLGVA